MRRMYSSFLQCCFQQNLCTICLQTGSSVDGSYSVPLIFAKLPEVNREGSQWTECEIKDTINLIYENLQRLDSYLSVLVRHYYHDKIFVHMLFVLARSLCSFWFPCTCMLAFVELNCMLN